MREVYFFLKKIKLLRASRPIQSREWSRGSTHSKEKDGQMMKSQPFDPDPHLKVAFRSVTSAMPRMMRNVCATGRASVACARSCETHCDTTDGLTDNSKTTIDCTGLTQYVHMLTIAIRTLLASIMCCLRLSTTVYDCLRLSTTVYDCLRRLVIALLRQLC